MPLTQSEASGDPLGAEVDLILVNCAPVGYTYVVWDGDYISAARALSNRELRSGGI